MLKKTREELLNVQARDFARKEELLKRREASKKRQAEAKKAEALAEIEKSKARVVESQARVAESQARVEKLHEQKTDAFASIFKVTGNDDFL